MSVTAADLDRCRLGEVGDTCNGEAGTRDPMNMTDPEALRRARPCSRPRREPA